MPNKYALQYDKIRSITAYDLKAMLANTEHLFFSRNNMKFFGDTMRNYGVRLATIETYSGDKVECYELYRRHSVKHGIKTSAYFDKVTLNQRFPRKDN